MLLTVEWLEKKPTLLWTNQIMKDRLQTSSKDFRNDFIRNVAEGNRPNAINSLRMASVSVRVQKLACVTEMRDSLKKMVTHNTLVKHIKISGQTMRARRFTSTHCCKGAVKPQFWLPV